MKPVFLNWRGPNGRETVDEFHPNEGTAAYRSTWNPATRKMQFLGGFNAYVDRMVAEYHLAGMAVYRSSRPCKGWRA